MKALFLAALCALQASAALAQGTVYVPGQVRRDGTYVQPHYRTAPDSSRLNNWSTQGNVNPYTGRQGTVDPYRAPRTSSSPYSTRRY